MQLTYRGVSYDYTPPQVNSVDSDLVGRYRGIDIRFRNPSKSPVQQPTLDLKYRGVSYRTGDTDQARTWELKREQAADRRQGSLLSRLYHEVTGH
ncbi:MAG: DUF4278 domain-containing protein [Oscillatoriales cyanobacterium]|nr:MAG: DUF4278 domain-containing protein [Oscillatoriales cyanobacterium]